MRFFQVIFLLLFSLNLFSQNYFRIEKDEMKLTDDGLIYYNKSLPSSFDITSSEHWPPVYQQTNWVCNQVAASFYMMSYETNLKKNLSSQLPRNCFSVYFPWNFGNGGYGWYGEHYIVVMEMLKQFGMPKFMEFPYDYPPDSSKWMTGYSLYYSAMHNKIEDYYGIRVNTAEGITALKAWVYNHGGGQYGGTGTFMANIAVGGAQFFPEGTPHEGAYVAGICGNDALHARTIVGYDNNVCYDYNSDGQYTNNVDLNGDGVIDVHDWEKGGFRLAESFGPQWQGDGYMWIMYKAMADAYGQGGILNNLVHVIVPDVDYKPLLTAKFRIKHTSREKIKISVGINPDVNSDSWDNVIDFPIFNYQGGSKYMQGGQSEVHKSIEAGVDITKLIEHFNEQGCAKLFFIVDESDASSAFDGQLNFCSFIDYTGSAPSEFVALSNPVSFTNNGRTVYSIVVCLDNCQKPEILTESIPMLSENTYSWLPLSFNVYSNPVKWEILPYFEKTESSYPFDVFSGTKLTPSADFDGLLDLTLPFDFPFADTTTRKIRIHTNGYILPFGNSDTWTQFRENLYPFFINESVIAPLARFSMHTKYSDGDGIWYKVVGDTVKVRWRCSDVWIEQWTQADFGCNLISDGSIEFVYGSIVLKNMYSNIVGISHGHQNDNIIILKDHSYPTSNKKIKIKPYQIPDNLGITNTGILCGALGSYYNYPFRVRLRDANNVSDTKTYLLTTFIDDSISLDDVASMYPNPATSEVVLRYNEVAKSFDDIYIYSVEGELVSRFENISNNEIRIDISKYNPGVYFVKIFADTNVIIKHFVKI